MRLFFAIDLPAGIVARIDRFLVRLRPEARIRWSLPANLHVTTKFIGGWPESRLDELKAIIEPLARRPAFTISIQGLGWFPNPKKPRVLWAGIRPGAELSCLARDTDAAMASMGIASESKPYSPHLTLARIQEQTPLDSLRKAIANLESDNFGSFEADRFWLYQSKLSSTGSVYTKLASFLFHP